MKPSSTAIPRCRPHAHGLTAGARGGTLIAAAVAVMIAGTATADDPATGLDASPLRFTFEPDATPVLLGALGQAQPADESVADWTMGEDPADESLAIPETLPVFGEAGSMRLDVRAGYGTDVKDGDQWIAQGGVGISAFIEDGLAIRAELNGAQIRQVEGSEQGINFVLLVEWHFMQRENWSLYLDAGAGVLFTTDDVPAAGSSFNFTPQAGVGFTLDAFDEARLVLGARWHHISNANTFDENPGRDHVMVYGGLSFPF